MALFIYVVLKQTTAHVIERSYVKIFKLKYIHFIRLAC